MESPEQPRHRVPEGAVCSAHADRLAAYVCARCGDFACGDCVQDPTVPVCRRCRERVALPRLTLHRESWTLENVFGHAKTAFMADTWRNIGVIWAGLVPYYLLVALPGFVIGVVYPEAMTTLSGRLLAQVVSIACMAIGAPFELGVTAYAAARVRGKPAGLSHLFSQMHLIKPYLVILAAQSVVFLGTAALTPMDPEQIASGHMGATIGRQMLASAIGSVAFLIAQFATIELVVGESNGGRALQLALGHLTRRTFGVLGTSLVIFVVMTMSISCCLLPAIPGVPFTFFAFTTLYLAIRTPAPGA